MSRVKVQPANAPGGRLTKDDFVVDLTARTVTYPAGRVAPFQGITRVSAEFGRACRACPLMARCTTSPEGRRIAIGPHEVSSPEDGSRSATPPGSPTTGPPGHWSSARSPTSCVGATGPTGPGSGVFPRSGPTSPSSPPP